MRLLLFFLVFSNLSYTYLEQLKFLDSVESISNAESSSIEPVEWSALPEFSNGSLIKWNITLCTLLYNSLPLTFQWIEFHRLQGVDHFVLYDDRSEDNILLLPEFYTEQGFPDLVRVLPASILRFNGKPSHSLVEHDQRQHFFLKHCLMRNRFSSRWILNIDIDEFIHVNTSITPSLLEYLSMMAATVDSLYLQAVRYGTSGLEKEGDLDIAQNLVTERAELIYSDYFLIWDRCRNRAPHPKFEANYSQLYSEKCPGENLRNGRCIHANGKVVFQPRWCMVPLVHECWKRVRKTAEVWAKVDEVRIDHFPFRSRAFMETFIKYYDKNKYVSFFKYDSAWFSSVYDDGLGEFVQPVSKVISGYPVFTPVYNDSSYLKECERFCNNATY